MSAPNDSSDSDVEPIPPKKTKLITKSTKKPLKKKAPTKAQKEKMFDFMSKHQDWARGRIKGKEAARKIGKLEKRLASILNDLGEPGQEREGKKWWKCWVSIRNAAKSYAANNYHVKDMRTGGGADDSIVGDTINADTVEEKYYTDDDTVNKIMVIIGWHSALGIDEVVDDLDDTGKPIPQSSQGSTKSSNIDDDDDDVGARLPPTNSKKPVCKVLLDDDGGVPPPMNTATVSQVVTSTPLKPAASKMTNRDSDYVLERLDKLIHEVQVNSQAVQTLIEHLKANSIMVLTPGSAVNVINEYCQVETINPVDVPSHLIPDNCQQVEATNVVEDPSQCAEMTSELPPEQLDVPNKEHSEETIRDVMSDSFESFLGSVFVPQVPDSKSAPAPSMPSLQ